MDITAAVVPEKFKDFEIRKVVLDDPRPDEVVVRIVASGMCQTDLHARDGYYPTLKYPAVFGHEGAGVVVAVGSAVRKVAPGDHVIISFPVVRRVSELPPARASLLSRSTQAQVERHARRRLDADVRRRRSCLQRVLPAIVVRHACDFNERFVVKVRKDAPLDRLGPFACSIQTGAGAVLNAMRPKPATVAWCSASARSACRGLMAAKHAGCDPLIAVDVHDSRLALARELGATHVINHANRTDVVAEISASPATVRASRLKPRPCPRCSARRSRR